MAQHVYHWRHGWVPLDHTAALSKAKGNHDRATAMLRDAGSHDAGMHNRRDVAKALVDLPSIPDATDRRDAMSQVTAAAHTHAARDLLPGEHAARLQVRQSSYRGETGYLIVGRDRHGRSVKVFTPGDRAAADHAATNIKAGRPAFSH